ncbi:MAG: hypothetical protein WC465_04185 [Patescibacteria group bacterium]
MVRSIFKKKNKNTDPVLGFRETEVWVADFGSPEIEELLRTEVSKLKPKEPKILSWIFTSLVVLAILVAGEYLLLFWSEHSFWTGDTLLLVSWLWRLVALIVWLQLGHTWGFSRDRILAVAFTAWLLGTILSGIVKIIYMQAVWAWLNLLIDPIWAILLVALVSALYFKLVKK